MATYAPCRVSQETGDRIPLLIHMIRLCGGFPNSPSLRLAPRGMYSRLALPAAYDCRTMWLCVSASCANTAARQPTVCQMACQYTVSGRAASKHAPATNATAQQPSVYYYRLPRSLCNLCPIRNRAPPCRRSGRQRGGPIPLPVAPSCPVRSATAAPPPQVSPYRTSSHSLSAV